VNGELIASLMIGVVSVCLTWEMIQPRRQEHAGLGRRWTSNIVLTLIGQGIAQVRHALILLGAAWLGQHVGGGLLARYDPGWFGALLIAAFVFELIGYCLHVLMHEVHWLWRFHAVHHTDTDLDVFSTYRHHPGEVIFVSAISIPTVLLLAPPITVVLVLEMFRTTINVLSHSNIYIPERLDRLLSWFVITPDFHRLHHCSERRYTNSNYGVTVPWFDRLFGTASDRRFAEQVSMELGLEYFCEPRDSRLDRLLALPFTSFPRESRSADRTSPRVARASLEVRSRGTSYALDRDKATLEAASSVGS